MADVKLFNVKSGVAAWKWVMIRTGKSVETTNLLKVMAHSRGFEPLTSAFGGPFK
jgi:hypothetical protein